MIDNTALGHRLISEQYGVSALPTTTWQIDVRLGAWGAAEHSQ
jgi:hypothetical protein